MQISVCLTAEDEKGVLAYAKDVADQYGATLIAAENLSELNLVPLSQPETRTVETDGELDIAVEEPVLGTGSRQFGQKRAKDMKPSEFIAYGEKGEEYLSWLLGKLQEAQEDPRAQQSPKHSYNNRLIPHIKAALKQF